MQFISRLPEEATGGEHYIVQSPPGGLGDTIKRFLYGEVPYIDLRSKRDSLEILVRVVLFPHELIQVDAVTYRLESAHGILLDGNGQMTPNNVNVSGQIHTAEVPEGRAVGDIAIWKRDAAKGVA